MQKWIPCARFIGCQSDFSHGISGHGKSYILYSCVCERMSGKETFHLQIVSHKSGKLGWQLLRTFWLDFPTLFFLLTIAINAHSSLVVLSGLSQYLVVVLMYSILLWSSQPYPLRWLRNRKCGLTRNPFLMLSKQSQAVIDTCWLVKAFKSLARMPVCERMCVCVPFGVIWNLN